MKNILLLWYMEEDNFGDTLLAETSKSFFEKLGFNVCSIDIGVEPSEIIDAAKKNDFIFFAGGGIIERYIPAILCRFNEYIQKIDIPYGVIGISVGNFDYSYKSISLGTWIDKAVFFYTRDERSKLILNKFSNTKKIKYSGDCVWYSKCTERIRTEKNGVGINIRNLPYPDMTGELNCEGIKNVIKQIGIDIFIMDSSNELCKVFSKEEKEKYIEYCKKNRIQKAENIISEIGKCKIIIAMRYHVILVAALLGIPSIAIMYTPKVKCLVEELGIENLAVDICDIDKIIIKYEYLCNHYDEVVRTINANVTRMKLRVKNMYEDITHSFLS